MSDDRFKHVVIGLVGIVTMMWLSAVGGCTTDEVETRDTLENSGFSQIEVGDFTFFGCGHGDKYGREFRAVNPVGKHVNGIVCCGYMKSCTVRF